ncbi:hypothetical protein JNUCC0626_13665 [Lentzea sp. JNUCC 0626]|uniref:hypothetical protein n=1 Tax=Lentzea sp. JNUCC 0626 TaxID=3367513 RepID=UPI003747E855
MVDARLSGHRVVIVGGSGRLGRPVALAASALGADLLLAGRDVRRLEWTAAEIDGRVEVRHVDPADDASTESFARQAGAADHLVSVATEWGYGPEGFEWAPAPVTEIGGVVLLAWHLDVRGSLTVVPGPESVVSRLVCALASAAAPVRVNVVSPGAARDVVPAVLDLFTSTTTAAVVSA